jgi:hypothetical protein
LGKGNDRLVASNNSLDVFFADLGEGDDTVVLIGNRFRGELEIDGGPGTDRLLDINNIALMRRWIRFE